MDFLPMLKLKYSDLEFIRVFELTMEVDENMILL
jgi:hypothetical protein